MMTGVLLVAVFFCLLLGKWILLSNTFNDYTRSTFAVNWNQMQNSNFLLFWVVCFQTFLPYEEAEMKDFLSLSKQIKRKMAAFSSKGLKLY